MSRLDKSITNAYYKIEIDPKTTLPKSVRLTVLTGRKGSTDAKNKKIVGGEHVAFHFEYRFSKYGKQKQPDIPKAAKKLLAIR